MSYLTMRKKFKLQLSPGLVASYDIQPGNGVGQFWEKNTHIYLLTYFPRTHTGSVVSDASPLCHKAVHSVPQISVGKNTNAQLNAGF